jgi:hypothetical protein
MNHVKRSGIVPSCGNLAPRVGQAGETKIKQDEMLHDWLGPGLPILAYCLLTLRRKFTQPSMWFRQHRHNLGSIGQHVIDCQNSRSNDSYMCKFLCALLYTFGVIKVYRAVLVHRKAGNVRNIEPRSCNHCCSGKTN